jgi:hypothetical protein
MTRPNALEEEGLLTENAAARVLCMSSRTLQTWRTKGRGPPFVRVGRAIRYTRQSLIDWTKANTVVPTKTK